MSGNNGFSQREFAAQNAKVEALIKEEVKLTQAIERGERTLAENREKLKETTRSRLTENSALDQMIQRGIRAVAKNPSKRAAVIAALLIGEGADDGEPQGGEQTPPAGSPTPTPTPAPAPAAPLDPDPAAENTEQSDGDAAPALSATA